MSHPAPLTILLIDDCAEDREVYRRFLKQDNLYTYRILEFETKKTAVEWCRQETPDIILLDLILPDGDGLEFIQKFREDRNNSLCPIIILTGQGDENAGITAMKNGAQDYLLKSKLTQKALQRAIHNAFERMRLTWQLQKSQEMQLISNISLQIRQSLKLDQILDTAVKEVRQFLKADRVVVYKFFPKMGGAIIAESVLPGWTTALGRNIEYTCLQSKIDCNHHQWTKRAINDIYQAGFTNCHLQLLEEFEVKANLIVPILVSNQLWGLLIAHQCSAPRRWQAVELDLLDQLGVQIAIAIQQATAYEQAQIELAERKRTEASLKASEEKLQLTLDFAHIGCWEWNLINNKISGNDYTIRCFGFEPTSATELTYYNYFERVHPDDREFVQHELRQAITTKANFDVEYRVVWEDGSIHWLSAKGRGVYDTAGQPLQMLGVLMDISERKQTEEALRQKDERLKMALEAGKMGNWDWNIQTGEIKWSSCLEQLFGIAPGSFTGEYKSILAMVHPDDRDHFSQAIDRAVNHKEEYNIEFRFIKADGTVRWSLSRGKVFYDQTGNPLQMIGIDCDITERKQAEAECVRSEILQLELQLLENILETAQAGYWDWNVSNNVVYFSPTFKRMFGYKEEELVNSSESWESLVFPEDLVEFVETFQQSILENNSLSYYRELRYRHQNGSAVWCICSSRVIEWDKDGKPLRIIGCNIDITPRKQTEAKLIALSSLQTAILNASDYSIISTDCNGIIKTFNARAEKMFGYTADEIVGQGKPDTLFHDGLKELKQKAAALSVKLGKEIQPDLGFFNFFKIAAQEEGIYEDEWTCIRKDGSSFPMLVSVTNMCNPEGENIGFLGIAKDITRQKQMEVALRESEHRYATLAEASPVGIFRFDTNGQCIYVNKRWSQMTGRPIEAALGMGYANAIHPEDRARILNDWSQKREQGIVNKNKPYYNEGRYVLPDGSIQWFYTQIVVEINANGQVIGYIGTITDITARKHAEADLQESERRYATLAQTAPVTILRFNTDGHCIYVNDRWSEMTGRPIEEALGMKWLDAFLPFDREYIRIHPSQWHGLDSIQEELYYGYGSSNLHHDNHITWFYMQIVPEISSNGEITGYIGTLTDITERKQSEEQLRRLSERLSLAIKSGGFGIWEWDIAHDALIWDERMYELYGIQPSEFEGGAAAWLKRVHPDDHPAAIAFSKQVRLNHVEYNTEFRVVHPDGNIHFIKAYALVERDSNGIAQRMVGVNYDITELKQAEQELIRSRDLQEAIFNESADAVFLVDPQTILILECNRRSVELFEAGDKSAMIGTLGNKLQRYQFSMSELVAITLEVDTKGFWSREIEYVTFRGKCFWGNIAIKPIIVGGRTLHLVRLTDISDRKQAQQELEESRTMLRLVLDTIPQRVFWKDCQSRYLGCNPAFARDCQLDPNEIIGKTDFDLIWAKFANIYRADDVSVINKKIAKLGYEQPLETANGKKLWTRTCKAPLTNTAGEVIGVLGLYEDITASKEAEEQLKLTNEQFAKTNAELARATRLKDEFLANMSHELRTPLNAILGMSEGLQENVFGDLNPRQAKALATIERSGKHLLELINDILDLSKIESGKLQLELSDVGVRSVCDSSLIFVRQMASKKKIRLTTNIPNNISNFKVDELRLRQALINLLSNAIKFTPEGGSVKLNVWLAQTQATQTEVGELNTLPCFPSSQIYFSVTDTGIGIAPENINKLFQPFVQLDSSLNRHYNGTGLGLALVKRIIALHGGTVSVSSEVGQGSCFTIGIPYRSSSILNPVPVSAISSNYNLPADHTPVISASEKPLKPPLILVAEDNQANIETMSDYLENSGYCLILATNGQEAVDLALAQQPDIILMDIQMPLMNGLEAICRIRENAQVAPVPIIALTALAMSGDGERCLAAGANEYLTKPVRLKQLAETIQKLLARTSSPCH